MVVAVEAGVAIHFYQVDGTHCRYVYAWACDRRDEEEREEAAVEAVHSYSIFYWFVVMSGLIDTPQFRVNGITCFCLVFTPN